MSRHRALAAPIAVVLGGCAGRQAALDPAGIQAERVMGVWWYMLIVAVVVFAAVVGAVLYGALRRRDGSADTVEVEPARERWLARWVGGAVAVSLLILFGFLIVDFATGRAMAVAPEPPALTIDLRGYQWWWEARYDHPVPSRRLTVANEIHVPVGRPVRLRLTSTDVIHSFWVPNLRGKYDLIPGHQTTTWFQADTPGVYRGQCAEFCGHQHAKMGMLIIAQPPAEFAAWYERQLRPAPDPVDSVRRRGRDVFLSGSCVMCHTIRGTPAGSQAGPELTHIASRRTLAAGTMPNTRGHLAGWIVDPQRIKPGVRMPPNQLSPDDLNALLDYLGSLR